MGNVMKELFINERCLFLKKFNYPFHLELREVGKWYRYLCDHCPLEDACVCEYSGTIPKPIKQKLKDKIVPCPKCDATDKWWELTEDGISCLHCGKVIYWHRPLKFTRARLDGGLK